MIHGFPSPYEDELLYSVFARHEALMSPSRHAAWVESMFGRANVSASADFPTHLAHLIRHLPPDHPCRDENFLLQHTLLRWYQPFVPPQRALAVRAHLLNPGVASCWSLAGVNAHRARLPLWLRYCPACLKEDQEQGRICYWRRLHQATGVEVCLQHEVYLEDSPIPRKPKRGNYHYYLPADEWAATPGRSVGPESRPLLIVAALARELLKHDWPSVGLQELGHRHAQHLVAAGYRSRHGVILIRYEAVANALARLFPADYLRTLGCVNSNCLIRFVRRRKVTVSPALHLLVMAATSITVSKFFSETGPSKPLPSRLVEQLPCVNLVCPTHGDSTEFLGQKYCASLKGLIARFRCKQCGQIQGYCREGRERNWVSDYGLLWRQKLAALWNDPKESLSGMGRILGRTIDAIKRQAITQGLPWPRPGKNQLSVKGYEHLFRKKQNPSVAQIKRKRARWLRLRNRHPSESTRQLRFREQALFGYLRRNDRAWLLANQPASRLRWPKDKPRQDWQARDQALLQQLEQSAKDLRAKLRRGRILYPGALAKSVGLPNWTPRRLRRLPRSQAALIRLSDSSVTFALRQLAGHHDFVVFIPSAEHPQKRGPTRRTYPASGFVRHGRLALLEVKVWPEYLTPPACVLQLRDTKS